MPDDRDESRGGPTARQTDARRETDRKAASRAPTTRLRAVSRPRIRVSSDRKSVATQKKVHRPWRMAPTESARGGVGAPGPASRRYQAGRRDAENGVTVTGMEREDRGSSGEFAFLYRHLRAVAERYFRNEPAGHTLQPTALVHEAFLRLMEQDGSAFRDQQHFCAAAAVAMRHVLVDHARRRRAAKRGGDRRRVTLSTIELDFDQQSLDILHLHLALERLGKLDPVQERIVVLKFFGGLEMREIAVEVDLSLRAAERAWRAARAWLLIQLRAGPDL